MRKSSSSWSLPLSPAWCCRFGCLPPLPEPRPLLLAAPPQGTVKAVQWDLFEVANPASRKSWPRASREITATVERLSVHRCAIAVGQATSASKNVKSVAFTIENLQTAGGATRSGPA